MGLYTARRVGLALVIVLAAMALLFGMIYLIPGDPATIALGPLATPEMVAAFRAGTIAGAALDVLPEEPPRSGGKLVEAFRAGEPWLQGRLVLTPHSAWRTPASYRDCRSKAVETAVDYLREGRLRHCVNRALLAAPRGA